MNQVVVVVLLCVVFGVSLTSAGHGWGHSHRCLCRSRLWKRVQPAYIHTVETVPPSPSCSKTEIILTVTGKGRGKGKGNMIKVCLDPNEKQGQRLLKGKGLRRQNKKQKNRGRKEKNKKSDRREQ